MARIRSRAGVSCRSGGEPIQDLGELCGSGHVPIGLGGHAEPGGDRQSGSDELAQVGGLTANKGQRARVDVIQSDDERSAPSLRTELRPRSIA